MNIVYEKANNSNPADFLVEQLQQARYFAENGEFNQIQDIKMKLWEFKDKAEDKNVRDLAFVAIAGINAINLDLVKENKRIRKMISEMLDEIHALKGNKNGI